MFTGIVVETGRVAKAKRSRGLLELEVEAPSIARGLDKGDSVAVNGVCLTATSTGRRKFSAQAMRETLERSTLDTLGKGDDVNLELAARLHDRIGGHMVQGHVDGVATAARIEDDGDARRVWLAPEERLLRYMVPKGSVTLDGVSLTLVEVGRTAFEVALIPHTLAATTLGRLRPGASVNVEVDVIAKYVERLALPWSRNGGTTP